MVSLALIIIGLGEGSSYRLQCSDVGLGGSGLLIGVSLLGGAMVAGCGGVF